MNFTVNTDGSGRVQSIRVNGNTPEGAGFYLANNFVTDGSVFLSGCPANGSTSTYYLEWVNNGDDVGNGVAVQTPVAGNIRFRVVKVGTSYDFVIYPMLESGTAKTDYEPYKGTTHTTTYPSAIYRGSEDVVNGSAEIVKPCYLLSDFTWYYVAAQQRFYTTGVPFKASAARKGWVLSSAYEAITDGRAVEDIPDCSIYTSGQSTGNLYIQDSRYSNPTDLVTNMGNTQICYELATPTTSSVTPTNLPIKSLFGYNHIESSTGDMEIEYITEEFQPIVDLIESNKHVYSTAEQIVGTWIDGSTVYEKVYLLSTQLVISNSDWTDSGISKSGLDLIIGAFGIDTNDKSKYELNGYVGGSGSEIQLQACRATNSAYINILVIRYTKSTPTRSLNLTKSAVEEIPDEIKNAPFEEKPDVNEADDDAPTEEQER
jgi:hypothetical protein